jgi:PAS domain S-box-containing protein
LTFLAESTGAGLWEWQPAGACLRCSAPALALLGRPVAPTDERELAALFRETDRARVEGALVAARAGAAGEVHELDAELAGGAGARGRRLRLRLRARGEPGPGRRVEGLLFAAPAATEAEERLERFAEAARVIVWEMDLATHHTRCSANAARIWGFNEGPGAAFFERIHPDDREAVRPQGESGASDERAYVREYRVITIGGETRWLQARGDVLCDEQGRPVRLVGVSVDITELKEAERAAREVGERLERAQRAARLGTWEWEAITGRANWSGGIYDLIGVPRHSFAPDTERWKEFVLPEDLPVTMANVGAALERGGDFHFEYRVRRADGAVRWLAAMGRVERGADGREDMLLGINIDVTARRLAEEDLRRRERESRAMFEAASAGAAQADPATGRLLQVNATLCAITGYSEEELLGMRFIEMTHPEDRGLGAESLRRMLRGETDKWRAEKRYLRKDGAVRWVIVSASIVRDEAGAPWRAAAWIVDITGEKQKEEELRETRARERAYLDHLPVGVWFFNAKGEITYGNEAARKIWGGAHYVGPERFGEYKAWWHGTDRRIAADEWGAARAIRDGVTSLDEVVDIECFDGGRKTMLNSAVPVRDADGRSVGAVIFNQDITALKEAERRLRDNESTLRSFYESSPLLMGVVEIPADDSDVFVVHANGATERFFRTDSGGLTGRGMAAFGLPRENVSRWVRHYRRSQADGRPAQFEFAHNEPDGAVWLACVVACIGPATGDRTRFSYVAQDVTARKRMELELLEAQAALRRHAARLELVVKERTAELRDANEQLETFVYSVAHDLRGPLRAVTGFAELLVEDYRERLDEAGRHMLDRIQGASMFMDRLVLDLLAFGRAARAEMELGPVSVAKAWEAAWFQCAVDAERSGARVEVEEPLPEVRAHEGTLGQMLANLLSNALKFVQPGRAPEVRVRAEPRGERVRLWVEDRGIGISPEQHERVFRVFERLDGARYSGTGVGLAIVRKGAERMGGAAGVESVPGEGSRFWIELPRA